MHPGGSLAYVSNSTNWVQGAFLARGSIGLPERMVMNDTRRILVPVDFSRCSRAALAYAIQRNEGADCTIDVLYVARPPHGSVPVSSSEGSSAARDLEHLVASMPARPPLKLRPVVEFGNPADVILGFARRGGHAQIVMGAHSRAARTDARLGSTADRVAHSGISCPVVTLSGEAPRPLRKPTGASGACESPSTPPE